MIYYATPWSYCNNYGKTLNHYMSLLPTDEDWWVFRDGDTMFLTEDWGNHIRDIINQVPDAGIITCYSNRIGKNHGQRFRGTIDPDPNIINHRKVALKNRKINGRNVTQLNNWITGVMMAVRKATWKQVPFPEDHLVLNVDKYFSRSILEAGFPIYRMDGMYLFHYYRLLEGPNWKDHLPERQIKKRHDLINHLVKKHGYTDYLEIGVRKAADNFNRINVQNKVGIDPDPVADATVKLTSDEFFASNNKQYDIVFIDGLHHAGQVYKDINNALEVLRPGGTIVCHDMNPPTKAHQEVPRKQAQWNGDCWKAWVQLRSERSDLSMKVINIDWGLGVIRRGEQKPLDLGSAELTYENLEKNRKQWLNLVNPEDL